MSDDMFEMPDMEEIQQGIQDAMEQANKALEDLPGQMEDLENVMGSLSSLVGGMPSQLEELTGALSGFSEAHSKNQDALIGDPDWNLEADIKVGQILHIRLLASLDVEKIIQTWKSTQGAGFESLVGGVVSDAAGDVDNDTMGQIMEQLKMGRGMARVDGIEVLSCSIPGAPGDAAEKLQLSPESNIPLNLDNGSIGFEFAPLLTIRNHWENAAIPTFTPMGEEITVALEHFQSHEAFSSRHQPGGQEHKLSLELSFKPME